jgi:proteasome inhibitor subunit 1 (PI31)
MESDKDILDPSAVLASLPNLLPPAYKTLKTPHDGIAALLHSAMVAVGFRLVAVDENVPARSILTNVLPDEWNQHGPGNYTLRYKHQQSSLEFLVKVVKLSGRTLVNAIAVEVCISSSTLSKGSLKRVSWKSDKAATLDICTNDFVSPSFYPYDASSTNGSPLVHGFISSNRVADLMSQFKMQIIRKLIPSLQKEGYTEVESSSRQPPPAATPANPHAVEPPRAPQSQQPPYAPINPLQIGSRDLNPIIDQHPFAPPGVFGNNGDGMFVGPNHPIFGGRNRYDGTEHGPWGGDGYLPPLGAPRGARFDPILPTIGPFSGMGPSFGPAGRGSGGNLRRFNNPDNDEFLPPGSVSHKILRHAYDDDAF